jgi:hypothetical protein
LIMKLPLAQKDGCRRPSSRRGKFHAASRGPVRLLYLLIDDAIKAGAIVIPARTFPGCTDAELLAIAAARHLLDGACQTQ